MTRLLPALVAAALLLSPLPAFAGAAEDAFLGKLVGTWSGVGTISGAESGALDCTLTFKAARKGVSFSGKCKAEDLGNQLVSGSIAYNDAAKHYEASGNGQVSVGVKSGSTVVFTSKIRNMAGSGNSVMKLTTGKITIDATVARSASADKQINSHVVLTK